MPQTALKKSENRVSVKNTAAKMMRLDFDLINEAIRRLLDGTGDLNDEEEFESASFLFNQMRFAFEEHFFIEEKFVFPFIQFKPWGISADQIQSMREQNQELDHLLVELKGEIEDRHGHAFHAALRRLSEALHRHTELEKIVPYEEFIDRIDPSLLKPLWERMEAGFLD